MGIFACVYVGAPHAFLVPREARRGCQIEPRVTDGCELPCGYWELNLGALEKQLVLLTAELSCIPFCLFLRQRGSHCQWFYLLAQDSVDQADLKLAEIFLPLSRSCKCRGYRCVTSHLLCSGTSNVP